MPLIWHYRFQGKALLLPDEIRTHFLRFLHQSGGLWEFAFASFLFLHLTDSSHSFPITAERVKYKRIGKIKSMFYVCSTRSKYRKKITHSKFLKHQVSLFSAVGMQSQG